MHTVHKLQICVFRYVFICFIAPLLPSSMFCVPYFLSMVRWIFCNCSLVSFLILSWKTCLNPIFSFPILMQLLSHTNACLYFSYHVLFLLHYCCCQGVNMDPSESSPNVVRGNISKLLDTTNLNEKQIKEMRSLSRKVSTVYCIYPPSIRPNDWYLALFQVNLTLPYPNSNLSLLYP